MGKFSRASARASLLLVTGGVIGLALGIWVQHRWPLGRMGRAPAPPAEAKIETVHSLAQLPHDRRLVLVCAGQSNAANYVNVRADAGAGVFAFSDGKLYAAIDPLPGGDGEGGSVWSRLGAQLRVGSRYDAIVVAVVAQGSTSVADWAAPGQLQERLHRCLTSLQASGIPADYVLWSQGETESAAPSIDGKAYAENLRRLVRRCGEISPRTRFVVAQCTRYGEKPSAEQIRAAQRMAAEQTGAAVGPDLDTLGAEFRSDGVHFNALGAEAASRLWRECLLKIIPTDPLPSR